jgi:hypothetical protein
MRAAVSHRPRLAHNFGAAAAQVVARLIDVIYSQSEVTEGVADVVLMGLPIVSEFNDGVVGFVAVADEGQGKFAGWVVSLAQQLHAQNVTIELDRLIQIVNSNHRMQKLHRGPLNVTVLLVVSLPKIDHNNLIFGQQPDSARVTIQLGRIPHEVLKPQSRGIKNEPTTL